MASQAAPARTRRGWRIAALALTAAAVVVITAIAAAPGVGATCTKILELAELAGEPTDANHRELCEERYGQIRASRGLLRWVGLSWCTRVATTIPEAGEC